MPSKMYKIMVKQKETNRRQQKRDGEKVQRKMLEGGDEKKDGLCWKLNRQNTAR